MRRLLITTDTLGGVFAYTAELARNLSSRGVEVVLATMGAPLDRAQRVELGRISGLLLHESSFALEWMNDPWRDVDRAGQWLLELAANYHPDVVHLNGYAHAALPWDAPALVVAHSCVLSWWHTVVGGAPPARYAEYEHRVRIGLSRAAAVVAPSRTMLEALRRHYGELPQGRVIENGVDPARFVPAAKQPFFLSAGRLWDRAKNLLVLAELAPELPWPLYVAGDPGDQPAPPSTESAPGKVHWLGKLSQAELSEKMAQASVFVHPALYEPFGLAPLEAALAGAALLLSDIPSLREIWEDNAVYVDPTDRAALASTLKRLAGDAGERARLGARARRHASRFTSSRMTLAYQNLYAELLERRGSPVSPTLEGEALPLAGDPT